jgi:hypothetical protein
MRYLVRFPLFLLCLISSKAFTSSTLNHLHTPTITDANAPWLTGPLLAPSSTTIPRGHFNVQPYTFFNTVTGTYDKNGKFQSKDNAYALIERVIVQSGVTSFMDVQVLPTASYRFTRGQQSTQLDDMSFLVNFQLWKSLPGMQMPNVKVAFGASAPIGKYHKLDPDNYGIDASGNGSWKPFVTLALGRLYLLPNMQFLSARAVMTYITQTPVQVKGHNVFGGASDTKGTAYPGNVFWADIGLEYTLSRNWVVALDTYYQYVSKTRFSGNPGSSGTMTKAAGESYSFAPAIEYNFNINIGIIAGVWFSFKGKNTPKFINSVISANFYI